MGTLKASASQHSSMTVAEGPCTAWYAGTDLSHLSCTSLESHTPYYHMPNTAISAYGTISREACVCACVYVGFPCVCVLTCQSCQCVCGKAWKQCIHIGCFSGTLRDRESQLRAEFNAINLSQQTTNYYHWQLHYGEQVKYKQRPFTNCFLAKFGQWGDAFYLCYVIESD